MTGDWDKVRVKFHKAAFQSQIWEFISSDGLKKLGFSGRMKGNFYYLSFTL